MGIFGSNKAKSAISAVLSAALIAISGPALPAAAALPTNSVAPSITGTAQVGAPLTGRLGTWAATPTATASQAWYSCTARVASAVSAKPAACSAISGATALTFNPTTAQLGRFISFAVTQTNTSGSLTRWSISTAAVASGPVGLVLPINSVAPSVTGTARVGSLLTGAIGTWTATPAATVTQNWYSCTAAVAAATQTQPSTCSAISAASATTYTPVSGDAARFLSFAVTETNITGAVTVWSITTAAVTAAPVNTVAPTISGTGLIAGVMTATTGTWTGTPAATYAYAWHRCTTRVTVASATIPTGCVAIATATAATYTLAAADAGQFVDVRVTATNSAGSATMWSISTTGVGSIPTNSVAPTVTGTASVGSTLTGAIGTWAATPAATVTQNWYQCTVAIAAAVSALPGTCTAISGAAATTYVPVAGDAGKFLSFAVTETNISGALTRWSITTAAITQAPSNTIAPTISGTGLIGAVETATTGTWIGTPAPTFTYAWHRCTARITATSATIPAGCTAITGATTATYTLAAADAGLYINVRVTATNSAGTASIWTLSTGGVGTLPVATVVPSISGTASVGSTLTGVVGTWTSAPAATVSQQWYSCSAAVTVASSTLPAGCTLVTGATALTYATTNADAGKYFSFAVTQTNIVGTVTVWSVGTGATQAPPLNTVAPSFTGNPTSGGVLNASLGTWIASPTATVTQAWYVCTSTVTAPTNSKPAACNPILNATGSSYTLSNSEVGKYISLAVTETNALGTSTVWSKSELLDTVSLSMGMFSNQACLVDGTGYLYCWEASDKNAIPTYITDISGAKQVAIDNQGLGICVLFRTGSVSCGGPGSWVPVSGLAGATSITAGGGTGCALLIGKTVKCWGNGNYGKLGNNLTLSSANAVDVLGLTNVIQIAMGATHVCSVNSAGEIWCWGSNFSGELGAGSVGSSAVPVIAVSQTAFTSVSAGSMATCAASRVGSVYCWGSGAWGQLGSGLSSNSSTPLLLNGLANVRVIDVKTTGYGNYGGGCSVTNAGLVSCWGTFTLGGSPLANSLAPQNVPSLAGIVDLKIGAISLALTSTGEILEWGAINLISSPITLNTAISGPPVQLTAPAITGTADLSVGNQIVANSGTYVGVDVANSGANGAWYRCLSPVFKSITALPADCENTGWNAASPYVIQIQDLGKFLTVIYSPSNSLGTLISAADSTAMVVSKPYLLAGPTVSGNGAVGSLATGDIGSWAGFPDQPMLKSVQWMRCSASGDSCILIPGATSLTYAPTAQDFGHFVSFNVTESNSLGDSTANALYFVGVGPVSYSTAPSISGTGTVGQAVHGDVGVWVGYPDQPTTTVSWYLCDSAVAASGTLPAGCVLIPGATSLDYVPALNTYGKYLSMHVSTVNSYGSAEAWSAGFAITTGPVSYSNAPSISGSGTVGQAVHGDVGVWVGYPDQPTSSVSWYLCDSAVAASGTLPVGCVVIPGATSLDYVPALNTFGKYLSMHVSAVNSIGQVEYWTTGKVIQPRAVHVAASQSYQCVLYEDKSLRCNGILIPGQYRSVISRNVTQEICAVTSSNDLYCGYGSPIVLVGTDFGSFSETTGNCYITTSSQVKCWGSNIYGQLGDGTWIDKSTSGFVSGIANVTQLVGGSNNVCALLAGGTVKCWGSGTNGNLGNGSYSDSNVPVSVSGLTGVSSLSAGGNTICAVIAAGAMKCWGQGGDGLLGNGASQNSNTPVTVLGVSGVTAIAHGLGAICAIVSLGEVKCWGWGGFGALGNGGTSSSNVPVSVTGITGAAGISWAGYSICVWLSTGIVKCWGRGDQGQLGNGVKINSSIPVQATNLTGVFNMVSSDSVFCAVSTGNHYYCWGYGSQGQLGNGSFRSFDIPQAIAVSGSVAEIGIASAGGALVTSDGRAFAWSYYYPVPYEIVIQ